MRLIGKISDEQEALLFARFLDKQGIACQIDVGCDRDWGSDQYGTQQCQVWIEDEDQVAKAVQWFQLFKEHRDDPIFAESPSSPSTPISEEPEEPPSQNRTMQSRPMGILTRMILIICCVLFFFTFLEMREEKVPAKYESLSLFISPIDKAMLYDYPKAYQLIGQLVSLYGFEALEDSPDLSRDAKALLTQINNTPFWQGFYHVWVEKGKEKKKELPAPPLFEKIRQGEVWRLFSPCLLHGSGLHLLFNMLWLVVLGKQLEQRMTKWRYILFMLIVGVISNTAQYLASGPNFIGFSGILCGMLAFVWVRQKDAPWEGYQIDRLTLTFMLIYVLGLAALQTVSFVFEKAYDVAFSANIANMAHLSGGIVGYLLGKIGYFSWRSS